QSGGSGPQQGPSTPPSYAVHADPHKSRPANLAPSVPPPGRPSSSSFGDGPTAPDAVTQPPPEAVARGAHGLPPDVEPPAPIPVPKHAPEPVAGPAGPAGISASATPARLNYTARVTGDVRATNPDLAL